MLSDDQAADFAAEKGFEYVINGEVDEYYAVAPMTFRADRAGIPMRILRTSVAAVVAFYSERQEGAIKLYGPRSHYRKNGDQNSEWSLKSLSYWDSLGL